MLAAVSRVVTTSLSDPALSERVAALALGLAPGRYPLADLDPWPDLAGPTAARFGRAAPFDPELWVLPAGAAPATLAGSGVAVPGLHVVRWLVGAEGRLAVRAGVGSPTEVELGPGDAVCWDIDRDPVALRSDARWVGVVVQVAAGPLAPVGRRFAGLPGRSLVPVAVAQWVGWENLLYTVGWLAVSAALHHPAPFVAATSFVHYGIYLATYARRTDIAFGEFLRDATWFKALSMGHLLWIVAANLPWSLPGAALVALGLALSLRAAQVLGVERTYFAVELGRLPPRRVDRFPYGVVPHPMITGAVLALIGVGVQPEVLRDWPWLIPLHVAAYTAHLAQEVFRPGHDTSAGSAPPRHDSAPGAR
ncbi:MAG: methyltransferase [Myxococcota bacterium]